MLPRSCLRLADSKSNSSTRFPRTTTTRVSSGWVASMSILLAIELTLEGAPASARPAPWRRRAEDAMRRGGLRGRSAAHSVLVGHPPHHPGPWIERLEERGNAGRRDPHVVCRRYLACTAIAAADAFPVILRNKASAAADPPLPAVSCGLRGRGSSVPDARTRQNRKVLNRQQPLHRAGAGGLASQACAFVPGL